MPKVMHRLFLLLAIGLASLIFYLSSQPYIGIPSLVTGQDKLMHFTVYGLLGFLSLGAIKPAAAGYTPGQFMFVIILVALYGLQDEIHQWFVPGRNADVLDVIADASGGIIGVWLMSGTMKRIQRRRLG